MIPSISFESLKDSRWYEYAIRFALGGGATVLGGIAGERFGPAVGGLLLALPAIFCASATMIEKHEQRRKRERGLRGFSRGREAAALDAAGAALGSLGMLGFALTFAWTVTSGPVIAFILAPVSWMSASLTAWFMWRHLRDRLRH